MFYKMPDRNGNKIKDQRQLSVDQLSIDAP